MSLFALVPNRKIDKLIKFLNILRGNIGQIMNLKEGKDSKEALRLARAEIRKAGYPPPQKATGFYPWMNAIWRITLRKLGGGATAFSRGAPRASFLLVGVHIDGEVRMVRRMKIMSSFSG